MKKLTAILLIALLSISACAIAQPDQSGNVWLAGFFLLKIRTGAGGYSAAQRVEELQQRANNLLQESTSVPVVTVRRSGHDYNIYTNHNLFMTVTAADARANGRTVADQANTWASRLRTILPQATPIKPGVGRPGQ